MRGSDAELIRGMVDGWNGGDVEALLRVFDPDVEVRPALSAFMASTVYRGHEGVRTWYAETNGPWAQLHVDAERFIEAGDRSVVIMALHARVPGGEIDVAARIAHVVTVRGDAIVRLDGYDDPDRALAAVGLLEHAEAC
jgi:ketosteroid isomerase-like protein